MRRSYTFVLGKIVLLKFLIFVSILTANDATKYEDKLVELKNLLAERGVPEEWFEANLNRENFRVYERMPDYFHNMAENRVGRGEKDLADYKRHFGVEGKVVRGKNFIKDNLQLLEELEQKNGIPYEIVVAILGMETNFAESRQRGNFYVFDALVSQYVLMPRRERFALNELVALYKFSGKIQKPIDYFIGSFAGASGWGQFIPTSKLAFFVSYDGIPENTDIFSIEDTLFSIENYLVAHGLNRKSISNERILRSSVYAYNHSNAYVDATLFIYERLRDFRD